MKNETNIYDIDNNLIREAGDNHKMTLEEAQNKLEEYRKKLSELPDGDPKQTIYATYMRNLSGYIMNLYATMPAEQLNAIIEKNKAKNLDEQVKKAVEDLKSEVEPKETIMDEYVNYEEVPSVSDIEPVEPEVLD